MGTAVPSRAGSWQSTNSLLMLMGAPDFIKRLLHIRGVHWLSTRIGTARLKSLSFDAKYARGVWDFTSESVELVKLVERYSGGGTCPIASALSVESFRLFVGVDLSPEAVSMARCRHGSPKIRFEVSDMTSYLCDDVFDVILFSDSLNYVPRRSREKLLRWLRGSLSDRGRLIVAIAQSRRYARILAMVRRHFEVEVDRSLDGGERHVVVFS